MPRIVLPFAGGSRQHRSSAVADQICRNFFIELATNDQGKTNFPILIGTPGRTLFADIEAGICRGQHKAAKDSVMWEVCGNTFYEIAFNGSSVVKGTLQTQVGPVYMKDNGTHILIIDGSPTGYVYDIAAGSMLTSDLHGTVVASLDATQEFVGGDSIAFIDGWFFVIQPRTNIIQACAAPYGTPPTTWGAADVYSTALADAGPLIALGENNGELWAIGDYSTKVFYNAANAYGFPFSERPGVSIPIGIAARASLQDMAGSLIMLAKTKKNDRFVVQSQGYGWQRISTAELEYAFSKYASVSDADAYTYFNEGHLFYQLTFTVGNQTWLWDAANPTEWYELTSSDIGRHKSYGLVQFNDKQIVGDRTTGKLYWQRLDALSDDGDPIIRTRRFQRVKNNLDPITINEIIVDVGTGVGLQAGPPDAPVQGEEPQMALRYTSDGGRNWSNDMVRPVGKIGEKNIVRVRFPIKGNGDDWSFEIKVSDPVQWVIMNVFADI